MVRYKCSRISAIIWLCVIIITPLVKWHDDGHQGGSSHHLQNHGVNTEAKGKTGNIWPLDESYYSQLCHRDESDLRGNKEFDKNFQEKLEEYAVFHKEQVKLLQRGGERADDVRTLTWYCPDSSLCSGLGDQLYTIQLTFLLALASRRAFFIHWDQVSMETMRYLQPQEIQWDQYDGSKHSLGPWYSGLLNSSVAAKKPLRARVCDYLEESVCNMSHTDTALSRRDFPVPLSRGISKVVNKCNSCMRGLLQDLGVINKNGTPQSAIFMNRLRSILLQYLFRLHEEVVRKVNEMQESVGLDRPYVGIHMRTGFLGNEYQEKNVRKFPRKIFRTETQWESTLNCSVELADSVTSPGSLLYLAADSYKVKKIALEMFPMRIVTMDIKLQHIIMTKTHGNSKLKSHTQMSKELLSSESGGLDGALGMWVDFLLLARSHAIVYPVSGFSTNAASFCLIPHSRSYRVPNCEPVYSAQQP